MANLSAGVFVPTYASTGRNQVDPKSLSDMCQHAEGLGFDSLWVGDHFLRATTYSKSWMDPFVALTSIAATTKRVLIGTSVVIAPLRDPVLLAKEAATLHHLSSNRLILGLGAGWNTIEFEAVRIPKSQRGGRLDETIEILRLLLEQPSASFSGRYYSFPEIAIDPPPQQRIPIWVGGGSTPPIPGASNEPHPVAADSVIQRIARSDGWSSVNLAGQAELASDWSRIQDAARSIGRNPSEIAFARESYYHIVDTDDREKALRSQREAFPAFFGSDQSWEYTAVNLIGTVTDIVDRIRSWVDLGATHFIFGPVANDPRGIERQLDLFMTRVWPQVIDRP